MSLPLMIKRRYGKAASSKEGLVSELSVQQAMIGLEASLQPVRPDMFHMDQLIRSRRVIRDVTYRWIPFLFVVLTVVVSTTLASTAGHPPRGIVVTFGVLAGLLVVVFLACHLMMYCTRIKHEMDAERASGGKDADDPDVNIPRGFLTTQRNIGTQATQPRRGSQDPLSPGIVAQRRQRQVHPSIRVSSYAPARFSAAQYNPSPLSQVTGYENTDRPQSQSTSENRAHQQNTPQAPDQTPSYYRHSSAVPQGLNVPGNNQEQPQPGPAPREPIAGRSFSRYTSVGDNTILHSSKTTPRAQVADPPPNETPGLHRAPTVRNHAPQQQQQRPRRIIPDYRPRDASTEELGFTDTRQGVHGISAFTNPPRPQARLALLGGPDVWDLVSRLLPDTKPGARRRRRRMSADDSLRRPAWGGPDDDPEEVVVLRDVGCKVVQVVHPAAPGVERAHSLRGSVRWLQVRDSSDSGYHSADSDQHPPPPPLQTQALPPDTLTEFSATSVSSAGGSWPLSSGGSRVSSSSSGAISEWLHPWLCSASSTASQGVEWRDGVSLGDADAISVVTGIRVRRERQGPQGRSESC